MVLLAGILAGGICIWFAIKIGFYETWSMLLNIVISIYLALFLTMPVVNHLPEETSNIPCCDALALAIIAVGSFLILHGISYILFTSQFKVSFPKLFDILLAGILGFFGGFLILSFVAIVISMTPFGKYAAVSKEAVKNNMSSAYWLFDGIHSIVSSPDNELSTERIVEQFLSISQSETQDTNPQKTEPDKLTQQNDV